jgi:hypothetical protein
MTTLTQAKHSILELLPELKGWHVYTNGIATAAKPPWVVVAVRETGRGYTESLHVGNHLVTLDIRVVGDTDDGVNIVCSKLQDELDGIRPADPNIGALLPETDSGVYSSELLQPDSSTPYVMRVLTWRTGFAS